MSDRGHAWKQPDDDHPLLRIRDDDTIKARFRKVAIDSGYPDMPGSALKVAVRLHLNMNKNGEVNFQASERELARATKLDKKAARDGVKFLEAEGLLDRTNMGRGKRGKFVVGPRLINLIDGQTAIDGYSDKARTALLFGAVGAKANCPEKGGTTAPKKGALCPEKGGTYPSPLLSPSKAEACSTHARVDLASTTERPLPSFHQFPRPASDSSKTPRPPVASATAKTYVAPATVDDRVAYGYGMEIAGLGERTSEIVDRLHRLEPLVGKDEIWASLNANAKGLGIDRVLIAIFDMEAKRKRNELRRSAIGALPGFARSIRAEDVRRRLQEIEAAATKPRISAAEMFGWSR